MATQETQRPYDRTGAHTTVERRGNVRRGTHAVMTARLEPSQVMGGGRDVSRTGAYFITSDEIRIELVFSAGGREVRAPAKITRVEALSPGTLGIAVQFERRLHENELP